MAHSQALASQDLSFSFSDADDMPSGLGASRGFAPLHTQTAMASLNAISGGNPASQMSGFSLSQAEDLPLDMDRLRFDEDEDAPNRAEDEDGMIGDEDSSMPQTLPEHACVFVLPLPSSPLPRPDPAPRLPSKEIRSNHIIL